MDDPAEGSSNGGKSLYMCFREFSNDAKVSYVIKSINLCTENLTPPKLHQVSGISSKHLPLFMGCGIFGSKIVFAGGFNTGFNRARNAFKLDFCGDVYTYETNPAVDPNPGIKLCSQPPPFQQGKPQPLLCEFGGKLFALASFSCDCRNDMSSPLPAPSWFEVFDHDHDHGQWSSLPNPPCYDSESLSDWTSRNFSYAVVDTSIFVSHPHKSTYQFNLASFHGKWKKVRPKNFKFYGPTLGVTAGEDASLIFSFGGDPDEGVFCDYISVHLILSDGIILCQPLSLPEDIEGFVFQIKGCRFVHLGSQQVCLLLFGARFVEGVEKIYIRAFTFEYKVLKTNSPVVEAEFKSTEIFEYKCKLTTEDAQIIGAFLL